MSTKSTTNDTRTTASKTPSKTLEPKSSSRSKTYEISKVPSNKSIPKIRMIPVKMEPKSLKKRAVRSHHTSQTPSTISAPAMQDVKVSKEFLIQQAEKTRELRMADALKNRSETQTQSDASALLHSQFSSKRSACNIQNQTNVQTAKRGKSTTNLVEISALKSKLLEHKRQMKRLLWISLIISSLLFIFAMISLIYHFAVYKKRFDVRTTILDYGAFEKLDDDDILKKKINDDA